MTRIDTPALADRLDDEWLEADGFGGFASGTVGTERTRRYHALLLTTTSPPTGRMVLMNGVEAWLETGSVRFPLSMQRYEPDLVYPDSSTNLLSFDTRPWPTWRYPVDDDHVLTAEVFVAKASRETVLRWQIESTGTSVSSARFTLKVRPLISGRDYHVLHHENHAFNFDFAADRDQVRWQSYGDVPAIVAASNGVYEHSPDWYRNFCYTRERERGMDFSEDLASPGLFSFDLGAGPAVMVLSANRGSDTESAVEQASRLADLERSRRASTGSRLERSADAFIVARSEGRTILAGFPWFTDWGRDTFIAMRGLLIGSGRHADAESILLEWAGTISEGMLPNRFTDSGGAPEFNSVDASLWFVVAVHDYLATGHASAATQARLQDAVESILEGYAKGTRFNIAADDDGLLRAGVAGVQLTWMDAKVGDWVVTPRIGKPVEVQALWINALRIASAWNARWRDLDARASRAFAKRFTDPATGALFDVVDVDHVPGTIDRSIRPNQIFAAGGLPFVIIDDATARAVIAQCEQFLLTPLGLRTLAPNDPAYQPRYKGPPLERDGAYHQGTVWPWLLGPFVEAWLRVHGSNGAAREQARQRFLAPLHEHLDHAGLDHISEVADGDPPHVPGGTPFQAWSLGELMRLDGLMQADPPQTR
jgi:predicted glycogen debranching enzyme